MYRVYARPNWGSVFVEALLALANEPYELIDVDISDSSADSAKHTEVNLRAQLPTIVTPDGTVVTESHKIAFYIAERAPPGLLAPPPGDRLHLAYRSWQINLGVFVDSEIIFDTLARWADGEEGRAASKTREDALRKKLLPPFESSAEEPWFLGVRFSTLDVFVSIMTRWSPDRDWYRENCPKLHAIAVAVDRLPPLKEIWARNFAPDKQYQ